MIAIIIIIIVVAAIWVEFGRQRTYRQAEFDREIRKLGDSFKQLGVTASWVSESVEYLNKILMEMISSFGVPVQYFKDVRSSNYQSTWELRQGKYPVQEKESAKIIWLDENTGEDDEN